MKIEKWRNKKKAVCKTARRAHSQKNSHHMSIVHDTRPGSDTFLGLFMLGCFCIWNASATNFENRCRILSFIKPFITTTENSYFGQKIIKKYWNLSKYLFFASFCNNLYFILDTIRAPFRADLSLSKKLCKSYKGGRFGLLK